MKIRLGYDIIFECLQPIPMILVLNVHPSRAADLLEPDVIRTDPVIPVGVYVDSFGNWCTRIVAPPPTIRIYSETLIQDSGAPDEVAPGALQTPVEELPEDVLVFLLASRYCETDQLTETAWQLFGHTPPGWQRVAAICEFVHNHIAFDYQNARHTRTALGAYNDGVGVCRDYAHLALTFCRCMNIPARYCTGYLGDIGVPVSPDPMDFSGWFEAYLGGRWYTFDARHNKPRIGRILMARGRDAADVAISTTFGPSFLKQFVVITDEVTDF